MFILELKKMKINAYTEAGRFLIEDNDTVDDSRPEKGLFKEFVVTISPFKVASLQRYCYKCTHIFRCWLINEMS